MLRKAIARHCAATGHPSAGLLARQEHTGGLLDAAPSNWSALRHREGARAVTARAYFILLMKRV